MSTEIAVPGASVSGGLATISSSGLACVVPEDHGDAGIFSKGRAFLPLMTLMTGQSKAVKEKKPGATADHFSYRKGKDQYVDLGEQVIIIPQAWRFCANQSIKNGAKTEYTASFDKTSALFLEFKAKADVKGCRTHFYGTECLVWLVEEKCYAILPFNNKTNRNIWPEIYKNADENRMGKPCVISSQLIDDGENQWLGYVVGSYMGQVDDDKKPSNDDFKSAMSKFQITGTTTSVQEAEEGVETVAGAKPAVAGVSNSRG